MEHIMNRMGGLDNKLYTILSKTYPIYMFPTGATPGLIGFSIATVEQVLNVSFLVHKVPTSSVKLCIRLRHEFGGNGSSTISVQPYGELAVTQVVALTGAFQLFTIDLTNVVLRAPSVSHAVDTALDLTILFTVLDDIALIGYGMWIVID